MFVRNKLRSGCITLNLSGAEINCFWLQSAICRIPISKIVNEKKRKNQDNHKQISIIENSRNNLSNLRNPTAIKRCS